MTVAAGRSLRQEAISLFRTCSRSLGKLPRASRSYYRNHVHTHFLAHQDETDPERIRALLEKGRAALQWVLQTRAAAE